jgi:hypothetical protein
MPPVEQIPDEGEIHRQLDFPSMYNDAREMIWQNIFQFPGGQSESVVWSKYVPSADDVHRLGCEREASTRARKPDMRYVGFITSTAGAIRGITTRAGHAFAVNHAPCEGVHHAEISYKAGGDRQPDQLKKNEKNELKLALQAVFGELVSHSCT